VALNLVLDLALYQPLGVAGIPLATSVTSLMTFSVLIWLLGRELGGIRGGWVLDGFVRSLVASAIGAVLAWATWTLVSDGLGTGFPGDAVGLLLAGAAGVLAYAAAAHAFEMPELRSVGRVLRPLR